MSNLLQKITAIRSGLIKSIQRKYSNHPKLKIKFVIATRNIEWTSVDLAKSKASQIAVITEGELDYYAALVKQLKHASRYQLLGHLFEGQKVAGLAREVLAARGKMGGNTFYTFLISPSELLKIAYVGHKASRDIEDLGTYQRMLQPARLKKVAEYINGGGKFPTNIVVNLKTNKGTKLRFDVKEKIGDEALGVLYLPPNYASAWIIDGQHRLYGYAYAQRLGGYGSNSTVVPVLAYDNLQAEQEMKLFIDVNSEQVKVNKGLLGELYSELHWKSSNPDKAFRALLSRIASRLNDDVTSPLYERMVVTGKKKTSFRCITPTSISDGLSVVHLVGRVRDGSIVPGPLSTSSAYDYSANLRKSLSVISSCLSLFSSEMPKHWDVGDGPGGYLCTNNGIRALFHVMNDVADHVRRKDSIDLYLLSADDTLEALEPYLMALVEFFRDASDHEMLAFRKTGSSLKAVREQAFAMESKLQMVFENFKPHGLQEYIDSLDEAGTQEARTLVMNIQKRLFDYVIGVLKQYYGTKDKVWWVEGVPSKIRQDCSGRWEGKDREGLEEEQLFLENYIAICIHNWEIVKDVISLSAKDKNAKNPNTKWIRRLNTIRNKVAHPEQGPLNSDQVEFVRQLADEVELYFPLDLPQG